MITDGNGNVLAGGERGGKSHITYKPYGEILRTDSYGPDITKFKYTGQEEDKESGLYYYKARYYDAALGRFAINDGQVFPDKEQGMNRMMYVEGNPVLFRDFTGNFSSKNLLQDLAKFALADAISKTSDPMGRVLLDIAGQKALFKIRKHKGSEFMRSDLGKIHNAFNPLNYIGALWALSNYAAGKLMHRDTKLKKVNGGYVVQGGPLMPSFGGGGIAIGQFAVTKGTDEATLRHETAHLQQYREWGPHKYLSNLGSSPFGGGGVGENDADQRAGTFAYNANKQKRIMSILISTTNRNPYNLNLFAIIIYLGYIP
ncbi:RHS repeat-associated core domain-containing protein [Leptospira sp. 96542]|nr:RHS repeat-associated core domain-containing protein [Leptospira sp. 96542]